MIAEHAACLVALTSCAGRQVTADPGDEFGAPEVGLPLLMFAGELAAVIQTGELRDRLPASLVTFSERAVTAATLTVAECLAGLVDAIQTYSELAARAATAGQPAGSAVRANSASAGRTEPAALRDRCHGTAVRPLSG
jgi:hypothetical protein